MEKNPDTRTRALLLQDFVDVECSLEEIRRGCCERDNGWISPLANAAGREGEAILMRIGPAWAAGIFSREVFVRLGPPRSRGDSVVVPLEWEAAGLSSLFPVLSGDLEIVPLGPRLCRVVLSASYVAPLGEVGRTLDRAILHRVAESTVRSFLGQLARGLEGDPAETSAPSTRETPAAGEIRLLSAD